MQIILASGSPRRNELFSWFGLDFETKVPEIDESIQKGEVPGEYCSRISRDKAASIGHAYRQALIIAADTVVVVRGKILGKPADASDACNQLRLLQGAMHEVYTGYTITHETRSTTRVIRTRVYFRSMSDEEITWYISTGEPMDKAGSYGLQGIGSLFIESIEGSYTNVIGLPMSDLYNDLKGFGIALHPIGEV
jgi:septum formation protein